MKPYRHILVGIDFSMASRSALRAAIRYAAFDDAKITAVHIIDSKLAAAIQRVNGFTHDQLLKNTEDSVHRFLTESEFGSEMVQIYLAVDHPFSGLVTACQEKKADLLVLGTRGTEHGPNQVGAVAAKCVRKAPADVMLVREDAEGPFKKALVCVDYSETSAKAVEAAGHLSECDSTVLDCVFVYLSPLDVSLAYGADFALTLPPADMEADIATCKCDLDAFVTPLLVFNPEITFNNIIESGLNVREVLTHYAQTHKADLVVMGTRGKSNLHTLIMGTTAESMIRHSACSVLAIKPSETLQQHSDD